MRSRADLLTLSDTLFVWPEVITGKSGLVGFSLGHTGL